MRPNLKHISSLISEMLYNALNLLFMHKISLVLMIWKIVSRTTSQNKTKIVLNLNGKLVI